MDAAVYKARYPEIRVLCPRASLDAVKVCASHCSLLYNVLEDCFCRNRVRVFLLLTVTAARASVCRRKCTWMPVSKTASSICKHAVLTTSNRRVSNHRSSFCASKWVVYAALTFLLAVIEWHLLVCCVSCDSQARDQIALLMCDLLFNMTAKDGGVIGRILGSVGPLHVSRLGKWLMVQVLALLSCLLV